MVQGIGSDILTFIREHHIFTLAVSRENLPWCATCYYVYLEDLNLFIFTSDHDTKHIADVVESGNYYAAGAIALETRMVGKIRGLQFAGLMKELTGNDMKTAKSAYHRAFPIARLAKLHLWGLEPEIMKMTDNRLGFGKKLIWRRNQQ
ncbi:MAG: hypothetical protein NTY96_00710 [Bacteroidetes bacterium]|nr:hypothetical protein [Bacteroidota bacterium]